MLDFTADLSGTGNRKVVISCIKTLENRCGHRDVHTCDRSFLLS